MRGALCQIVEKLLREAYSAAKPGGREGLILFVQTFGDLVTFNPHIHVLAADGVFAEDGAFFMLPPVPHRSHLHKSLKRNYQLMPGTQWLELLCRHIPDRFEHLVR